MPLTPNNREEHWLQGMVDGQTTLEPNKRREYWYKEIVDAIGSGGGGGGGGGGAFIVPLSFDDSGSVDIYTCDKKASEILSALKSNSVLFVLEEYNQVFVVVNGGTMLDGYSFGTISMSGIFQQFTAASADDYPTFVD